MYRIAQIASQISPGVGLAALGLASSQWVHHNSSGVSLSHCHGAFEDAGKFSGRNMNSTGISEIKNFFSESMGNRFRCFGCSKSNSAGLQMKVYSDNERNEVFTRVCAQEQFESFAGIVHGGILSTVIDDTAFWTLFHQEHKLALTTKLTTNYKRPWKVGETIEAVGRLRKGGEGGRSGRVAVVDVTLFNSEGSVVAEGNAVFMLVNRKSFERAVGVKCDFFPDSVFLSETEKQT